MTGAPADPSSESTTGWIFRTLKDVPPPRVAEISAESRRLGVLSGSMIPDNRPVGAGRGLLVLDGGRVGPEAVEVVVVARAGLEAVHHAVAVEALAGFRGVRRRLELLGDPQINLLDEYDLAPESEPLKKELKVAVEDQLLAPLDRMADRTWRRSDPAGQRRLLDEVRPEGAEPLERHRPQPALDADFENDPELRELVTNRAPKWGNDDDEADGIMQRVYADLFAAIDGKPNTKGTSYHLNMLSTTCHVYFGKVLGASANGRLAGLPISDGIESVR